MVIKYGGNAMVNEALKRRHERPRHPDAAGCARGAGTRRRPGDQQMLNRVGVETQFVNGLRLTDDATMEIVQQVLAGQVNEDLVAKLLGPRCRPVWSGRPQISAAPQLDPQTWAMSATSSMWTPP